jgi:hypothetical protein
MGVDLPQAQISGGAAVPRLRDQRVEDNAFHLGTASGVIRVIRRFCSDSRFNASTQRSYSCPFVSIRGYSARAIEVNRRYQIRDIRDIRGSDSSALFVSIRGYSAWAIEVNRRYRIRDIRGIRGFRFFRLIGVYLCLFVVIQPSKIVINFPCSA